MQQSLEISIRDQLSANNKREVVRQSIVLKYVPTLVMDVLCKVQGDELTFMAQDMA